ncbi:M50 family metallopeptidase [Cellulomonas aerilata]|uniref:Peptidase n=1 Tax=Cellulomonas aerilata TaxID=515326 RepID=A0A512DGP9_9CELL|nr:site-2 protease family protein [Cellulomonas aerilata]GEO35635.1 peptidase [Cellulomonas aerilata]
MAYAVGVLVMVVGVLVSIALHEVGHMVPAKRFGVRVSQYMVGFGPTLWSRTRGETEYGLKAIPLGGYVRLVGMYPPPDAVGNPPVRGYLGRMIQDARESSAREIRPGEDHRAFYRLSTPKKLVVMLGGPVMNLVIAAVLLTSVMVGFGLPGPSTTVDSVSDCVVPATDDSTECGPGDPVAPAAAAGVEPGDTIVAYAGADVSSWDELQTAIRASDGDPVPLVVERDGEPVTLTVTPLITERPALDDLGAPVVGDDGELVTEPVGFLGVGPTTVLVREPVTAMPAVLGDAVVQTMRVVVTLPTRIADVAQAAFGSAPRDPEGPIGVVGISRVAGEVAADGGGTFGLTGQVLTLLTLVASLNIALFVFNLIPILPLDGGHVAGALWEGAKRQVARMRGLPRPRPADIARMTPLTLAMVVVFLGMGALLVYADLVRPVTLGG